MTGGTHIVGLHRDDAEAELTTIDTPEGDEAIAIEPVLDGDPAYLIEDESEPRSGSTTLWAGIAIVAVLAWLGGMVWLARGVCAAPPAPIELVQFLAAVFGGRKGVVVGEGGEGLLKSGRAGSS